MLEREARDTSGKAVALPSGGVEMGNNSYDASLSLRPGEGERRYVIRSADLLQPNQRAQLSLFAGPICELGMDLPFAEVVRHSDVTVEKYDEVTWQNRRVKRLRLSLNARYNGNDLSTQRNDYYFAPDEGWLCIDYRERSSSVLREGMYEETIYTFPADRSVSGFVPVTVESFNVDETKNQRTRTRVYEVTNVVPRVVRPEEYHLSGYGLPEPHGVTLARPTPVWVWLVVAGAVMGLAVLASRRRRRRRGNAVSAG